MLATQLAALTAPDPAGVADALDVVAGFDGILAHGFGRLGEDRAGALAALSGAVAGTPLRDRVAEATEKVVAGSVSDEHLVALAGARSAVLGAVHDALLDRFDTALGRARSPWAGPAPSPLTDPAVTACRAWLTEVAVAGWRGVDHDHVSAAAGVLPGLLAQPRLRRLAVLLDGFVAELRACSPVARLDRLPLRRWADLWSRAFLLSHNGSPPSGTLVSGRLLVLGVDVHEHGTAAQVQVHGVLESAGTVRLVRTGVALSKVDTIAGPGLWHLVKDYPVLTGALARRYAVEVSELILLDSGDLVWDEERVRLGEPVDPFATARLLLPGAEAPAVAPFDRHPVRIAEPVLVEGRDDDVLPVALDRLPWSGPLTPALVAGSSACLGLVRWDGRWLLQPLAVQSTVKKRTVAVHVGDWAAGVTDPKVAKSDTAGDAVAVLRERAGRLLRK